MAGITSKTNVTFKVGASLAGGATTETTIALSSTQARFILRRVKIKRSAGTAANLTPYVVNATGAASTSINKVYLGAVTAVGTLFDQSPNAYDTTDISGNVYLVFGWDAAADNVASYELVFEILS